MKKSISLLVLSILSIGMVYAQASKTMYVSIKAASLKNGTGFFASEVASLQLGTQVTVLKTDGKWNQISSASPKATGWIASTSLTSKKVASSGSIATAQEIALAGKGFSPASELDYKASTKLDFSVLDSMEAQKLPNATILKFIKDGRLNEGK
ncbi:SH3 domain-containing protein [Breznakiellaceae bacterium SP9]